MNTMKRNTRLAGFALALVCFMQATMVAYAQQTLSWTTGVTANDQATGFRWFGVQTPATADSYQLSALSLRLVNGSKTTDQSDSYIAIATAATSPSSVPEADVVAVSSNHLQPTAEGDYTYTFASPVTLQGNTTYYLYWVTSNTPTDGAYTAAGQRARVRNSTTYTPGVYLNGVRTDLTPVFSATLTYSDAPEGTRTFTVSTQPAVDATFTWNGQTKRGTSATFYHDGTAVTGEAAAVSVVADPFYAPRYPDAMPTWDGMSDATAEVKMLADVFCNNYGEKWVRIDYATDPAYAWHIDAANNYEGSTPKRVAFTTEADTGFVFCFVGTPESFKIYSRLAGEGYALTTDGTNDNGATTATSIYLTADVAGAKNWTANDTYLTATAKAPGFVIHDTDVDGKYGANPFQRFDYALRYWDAEGEQTHWLLQPYSDDAIFSGHYGEKWVRMIFSRNTGFHWSVASATDVPKCTANATPRDGNLFCLVGTPERFRIFSKIVGTAKAMATTDVANGNYATFVTAAEADFWTLGSNRTVTDNSQADGTRQTTGSPIFRFGSESANLSLNAYQGTGKQLAYWSNTDGGSLWLPELYVPAELDIFCETYGEKWVRVTYGASNRYCLMVTPKETLSYDGTMVRNGRTDMTHEGQLWCFVGDKSGFKLYNRLAGEGFAAATGTALNGTKPLVLVAADRAETFVIQNEACLSSTADLTTGIAPIGSNGSPAGAEYKIGFLSASNSKCSYLFEKVGATLDISLTGLSTELPATHSHIARGAVTFPIDGGTRQMSYNLTPIQHTLFLPEHGTLSFTKPVCWIGFTFGGFYLDGAASRQTLSGVNSETASITARFTESNPDVRYIAYDGDERDIPYRIPSIARAANGDLIAMYDLRYNEADIGYYDRGFYHYRIDLVMKVSKDGGQTWGEEQPAATGDNSGRFTAAFGDAAMVADRDKNLVLVLAAAGNTGFASAVKMARFYLKLNETTGEWEPGYLNSRGTFVKGKPQDITDYMLGLTSKGGLSPQVYSAFCGSGRMSQSCIYKKDDYYRVYFTAIVKSNNSDGTWGQNGNITYYSDDFGQTWNILGECAAYTGSDEPKCDELPNGDIWMCARHSNGRNFNIYHFTDIASGEGTWLNRCHTQGTGVTNGIYSSENACNGDILLIPAVRKSDNQAVTLALASIPGRSSFSDPVWGANGRRNVSIFYKALATSSDYATTEALASNWEGRDASTAFLVSDHMSAYSSMCLMLDGRVGFFLEDDVLTGTAPWSHFDMAFIPYTIEEITGGKYTIDDTATGLSIPAAAPAAQSSAIYDLQGRRVASPQKGGVYITGGRKVVY